MIKNEFRRAHGACEVAQRNEYSMSSHITAPIVFDVDCVFEMRRLPGMRCDEFIFFDILLNLTGIYLIERKDSHSADVTQVTRQLQGGATLITNFLNRDPALDAYNFEFLPVLVSRGITPSKSRKLQSESVTLRGKTKRIRHARSKCRLPVF